jgi:flagellar hook-associated protein 1 FlgK
VSLFGALQVGKSALTASQAGIQVTGNNIANAGTEGYVRQTARMSPAGSEVVGTGQRVGTGVMLQSIDRQVNESIQESLRQATSGQSGADTLNSALAQLEGTFGALNDNDLSARLDSFFNNFSTLANNPQDAGQRSVVIQGGVSLASYVQNLRTQITSQRTDLDSQIGILANQAQTLTQNIARLNGEIVSAEANGSTAGALRDQRDSSLSQLAELMDIRVVNQVDGSINVLIGSTPLVQAGTTRGVSTAQGVDPTGQYAVTNITFGDNGDPMNITGGKMGALINARDNYVTPAITTVDNLAAAIITTVNTVHSQGQGLEGYSTLTGSTQVSNATASLSSSTIGLPSIPVNGTFNFNMKDATTGLITTRQITVNLSGNGTQTTITNLAAAINAAAGGNVSATVTSTGQLSIASTSPNTTFTFSDDSSGILASLGVNTFFSGKNATNIAVNPALLANAQLLATGRDNIAGSNRNAQAIATAGGSISAALNNQSIKDYYANFIGDLAVQSKNAMDEAATTKTIHDTIFAQQQAISGVDMNEEAINLTKYQQAFNGSARYISVVNDMMNTVMGLVS